MIARAAASRFFTVPWKSTRMIIPTPNSFPLTTLSEAVTVCFGLSVLNPLLASATAPPASTACAVTRYEAPTASPAAGAQLSPSAASAPATGAPLASTTATWVSFPLATETLSAPGATSREPSFGSMAIRATEAALEAAAAAAGAPETPDAPEAIGTGAAVLAPPPQAVISSTPPSAPTVPSAPVHLVIRRPPADPSGSVRCPRPPPAPLAGRAAVALDTPRTADRLHAEHHEFARPATDAAGPPRGRLGVGRP